jgi:hypothetical protein
LSSKQAEIVKEKASPMPKADAPEAVLGIEEKDNNRAGA